MVRAGARDVCRRVLSATGVGDRADGVAWNASTRDGGAALLSNGRGLGWRLRPAWSATTVDQKQPYTITGAPRIANGKVIIGNGGAEYGVRGYVSAYDA